jgi:uncharacterized membrane protein YphA (DoxX/SURF4 family)
MVFLIFQAIAILGFLINLGLSRRNRSPQRALDLLLRWSFGVAVGLVGVFNFFGHTFDARQVAEEIGFPPDNPFQWEVAWANLGIGVIGVIAAVRRDFWWPTAIMSAIFSWGAAWGHIYQLVVNGNHHAYNAGPILYTAILLPLAILCLLVADHLVGARSGGERATSTRVSANQTPSPAVPGQGLGKGREILSRRRGTR